MHDTLLHVYPLDVAPFPLRSADEIGLAFIDTACVGKHANNRCGDFVGIKVIWMMLTVQQIQQTVSAYFKDKPVKKVYLFGSYARGEAKEDSDVDLGIVLEDVRMSIWQYAGMALGLEDELKNKVD